MKRIYFIHGRRLLSVFLIVFLSVFTLKATKVPFASTDVFATVYAGMSDGDTLLLTTPGTTAFYTTLNGALTKSITIMADPSLTSRPVLSTNSVGSVFTPTATVAFSKIEFNGIEAFAMAPTDTVTDSRYFLDARLTTGLITNLKFKNCNIHGYSRCVVRADGSTPVFTNFIIDSCMFYDNSIGAASYPIFGVKSATITNISITNSSFYNSPGNVMTYSKTNALTFLMQNCNIIDCGSFKTRIISSGVYADSNPGRIIDFTVAANAGSLFTITNCIIAGKYTNKDNRPLANKVNTGPYAGVNQIRLNNVTSTNCNFVNSVLFDNTFSVAPGGTNTPIATTAVTSNYAALSLITVPSTITGIGDPRWKLNITDASLSDLKVDGVTVAGFAAGTRTYDVVLPVGTTTIPTITSVTTTDAAATSIITQAPSVTGAATVEVKAKDGTTKITYTINFSVTSTDATLTALNVAGNTLSPVFDAATTTYNVLLPSGTTIGTLPAVTYTTAAKATAVKTNATALPGATTIEVTAQDGVTKKTYTINFEVANSDATLTTLLVAGNSLSPAFDAATITYNVLLPVGTTIGTLPEVTYTAAAKATAVKTDATALPGSTTIEVTAQDGTTKITYTINFSVPSTDASLTALAVDGNILLPAFDAATLSYDVILPAGTSNLPAVTYTAAAYANAVKTDVTSLPAKTKIDVTAQDGINKNTYTINYVYSSPLANDGDFRSVKTGGGWSSASTFEVYTLATDSWATTTNIPTATTNATIMDGVYQTCNSSNAPVNNLIVGQGNAFSGLANLTGTAVSSVTVKNSGALMANPGITFIGQATTTAAGYLTFKVVGAYYRNKGAGYTSAPAVSFGITAWAAGQTIVIGQTRSSGGNLYNSVSAGTTGATAPTGTGKGISDGAVTWNYVGTVPTARAIVSDGKVAAISITNSGSGIISGTAGNSATLPAITIAAPYTAWAASTAYNIGDKRATGGNAYICTVAGTSGTTAPTGTVTGIVDGTVTWDYLGIATTASYAVQMGVDSVVITAGGNYAVAPTVAAGSVLQLGNATTSNRSLIVSGNLTFKNGSQYLAGPGGNLTESFTITGNLTAESPINFLTKFVTFSSVTNVSFAGATSTITGPFTFNNLNSSVTSTVVNNGSITISGTSNIADIISFNFTTPPVTGTVNSTSKTVALTVPFGTSPSALAPTISVRGGVTVSPASEEIKDFTSPVTYTVKALNDVLSQNWTATVTVAPASTDASLTLLSVTGNTLSPAFSSSTYTYDVILPAGTTVGTLPAVTFTTAANATAVKTDASVLPGSTTIEVTAQDGTTKKTYTINFTVASSDATLTALSVAGNTLLPVFDASTLTYNVLLPVGTTIGTLPAVTYTTAANATAVKTDAIALPGSSTIEVTAQDGVTKKTYTINFAVTSTDATLTALAVSGNTLSPAFDAATYSYNVVLPNGTTIGTMPAVTYTTAANATAVKTDAIALPGSTTIEVTAQDGTTKLTYTVNFSVAPSTDATLSDLKVNSATVSGFAANTFTYNVVLPNGTTVIPTVAATATHANANAVVTQALSVSGSATVVVTAQDGTTKLTYTVNFSVAPSTDATLSALKVNGISVTNFSANTLTYNVVLAAGTTVIPTVSATVNQANANAVVTQALSVTGSATVVVTAQDGTSKKTYTINFSVATSNRQLNAGTIKLLANRGSVTIESSEIIKSVKVITMKGTVSTIQKVSSTSVTLNNLKSGAYILVIKTQNNEYTKKIGVVE
jgi:hypothetical protein